MKKTAITILFLLCGSIFASQEKVELFFTDTGKSAGSIVIEETKFGLLFTPSLSGLTSGSHGFHVHEHPSCDHEAMDALGHFDPAKMKKHQGPYREDGHLGDLPNLFVDALGQATLPVLAPRLQSIKIIQQRALMIHANPDNYSDYPEKLGGSGARVVCGVVSSF